MRAEFTWMVSRYPYYLLFRLDPRKIKSNELLIVPLTVMFSTLKFWYTNVNRKKNVNVNVNHAADHTGNTKVLYTFRESVPLTWNLNLSSETAINPFKMGYLAGRKMCTFRKENQGLLSLLEEVKFKQIRLIPLLRKELQAKRWPMLKYSKEIIYLANLKQKCLFETAQLYGNPSIQVHLLFDSWFTNLDLRILAVNTVIDSYYEYDFENLVYHIEKLGRQEWEKSLLKAYRDINISIRCLQTLFIQLVDPISTWNCPQVIYNISKNLKKYILKIELFPRIINKEFYLPKKYFEFQWLTNVYSWNLNKKVIYKFGYDFLVISDDIHEIKLMEKIIISLLTEKGLDKDKYKNSILIWENGAKFNYLGFTFHYIRNSCIEKSLSIYPSNHSVKCLKHKIKEIVGKNLNWSPYKMLSTLNPILRDWKFYYGIGIGSLRLRFIIFNKLDHFVYYRLLRYLKRKFKKTPTFKIVNRYFKRVSERLWQFHATNSKLKVQKLILLNNYKRF